MEGREGPITLRTGSTELTPFGTERRTREARDQETFGRGYAHVFVAAAPIGSIALLGLASVLWYREIARLLPPRDAAVGVVAAIVAGPLLWYTFFEPSMSHAPTAACLVFAMVAWRDSKTRTRGKPDPSPDTKGR